jgi:hypothetical protein
MPCACCSGNHCDSDVNGCDGTGSALTCQGVGTPSHNNETNGGSNTEDGPRCDGPGWANHTCTSTPTTCQELTQMIGPGGCGHGCSTEFKEFAKKHLIQHKDCSASDSGTKGGKEGGTTTSGTESGAKGDKEGGTKDDGTTTTTTRKKVYVVKHKITISNMSPDSFNTNPDIKRAFGQAVSTLLNVDVSRVFNIRACLIGSTDAECPGEISADTSSPVETTNGGRLLLRIRK